MRKYCVFMPVAALDRPESYPAVPEAVTFFEDGQARAKLGDVCSTYKSWDALIMDKRLSSTELLGPLAKGEDDDALLTDWLERFRDEISGGQGGRNNE